MRIALDKLSSVRSSSICVMSLLMERPSRAAMAFNSIQKSSSSVTLELWPAIRTECFFIASQAFVNHAVLSLLMGQPIHQIAPTSKAQAQ